MQLGDALAWLDAHNNLEAGGGAAIVAGDTSGLSLATMESLCHLLGDPQSAYRVVHVTGTNGKGSVSAMVTALLVAHGLSVGTYTSPHLATVNERIAVNGEPVDDDALAEALTAVAAVEPLAEGRPSWFEALTAAALGHFAVVGVDVAVVEVGLLGTWDATNVVSADVAVVTNIGADHTDGVGEWRAAVATEKAGIIKASSVVVLGEDDPALTGIFTGRNPAELWLANRDFGVLADQQAVGGRMVDVFTPLARHEAVFVAAHGHHQARNAAMAITATEGFFGRATSDDLLGATLGSLRLPGRFEVLHRHPLVVADTAHNPPAAAAAAATLNDEFHVDGRRVLVLGMLAGRSIGEFLAALEEVRFDAVVATTPTSPRAVPASELAASVAAMGLPVEVVDDPADAIRRAVAISTDDDLVFVTGSTYLVGAVRQVALAPD